MGDGDHKPDERGWRKDKGGAAERDKSSQKIYLEVEPTGHDDYNMFPLRTAWDKPRNAAAGSKVPGGE